MIHPCSNTHTNIHATPTDFLIHSNYSACYYCLILLSRSLYLCSYFIPLQINATSIVLAFRFRIVAVHRRRAQNFCWFTRSNYMDSISYKGWNDLFSFHSDRLYVSIHICYLSFLFQFQFLQVLHFCQFFTAPHTRDYCLFLLIISISSFFSIFSYFLYFPFGCAFNNFILHLKQIRWTNVANNQIINMFFSSYEEKLQIIMIFLLLIIHPAPSGLRLCCGACMRKVATTGRIKKISRENHTTGPSSYTYTLYCYMQ